MFSNAHNLVITGGNFNHFASPEEVADLNFFQDYVALGALHNSGERFDPPKCHPNTRVSILQKIMEWIKSSEKIDELILWIYGAAGAGKSAIAQTVAEMCEKEGILLGSFFFSRTSPGRSDGNRLIPTLAYQMAVNLPKTRSHIKRAFQMNPFIFSQNMESQRDILISQPLKKAISRLPGSSSRQALIIDGLDECSDPKVHSQLLTVLVSLAKEHPSLRILIASRPEHHILSFFNSQLEHAAFRIALNDSQFETDDDVRMFLCSKFAEIVRSHPLKDHIPPSWPSISALETIVSKASGQFIHASTVIKYIDSPRHNPMDRLNVILQLSPSDAHSAGPYEELDSMYRYILASVENVARTKSILGLTLLTSDFLIGFKEFAVNCVVDLSALHGTLRSIPGIAQILDISEEDVLLSLTELASVLQVEFVSVVQYSQDGHPDSEYFQEGIKFFHASFDDFLKDPTRSKHFYISMGALHHLAAKGCLRILARIARSPTSPNPPCSDPVVEYAVHALMIHFWKATLTKGLLDDLEKFDFRSWLVCNIRWYSRHFPPCEDWEDGASAKSTAINLALFFRRLRSLGEPVSGILRSHLVILEEQLRPYPLDPHHIDRLSLFGGWIFLYEFLDVDDAGDSEGKSALELLFSNLSFNCLSNIVKYHLFNFQIAQCDLPFVQKVTLLILRCLRFLFLGDPPLVLDPKYRTDHAVQCLTEIAIRHFKTLSLFNSVAPELTAIVEPLYRKHWASGCFVFRGGNELKNAMFQYLQTQSNIERPEDADHRFTVSHLGLDS